MLGNFPKAFPNLQLPNGIFPSGNFPMDFSHAATSQLCNVPSGKLPSLLAATLAPPPLQPARQNRTLGECM